MMRQGRGRAWEVRTKGKIDPQVTYLCGVEFYFIFVFSVGGSSSPIFGTTFLRFYCHSVLYQTNRLSSGKNPSHQLLSSEKVLETSFVLIL